MTEVRGFLAYFLVKEVYIRALNGELALAFSVWNIGESLGVLRKYFVRGWLDEGGFHMARDLFIAETIRLLKLGVIKIVPVKTKLLAESWKLIEKHHIYEADALQIISAKYMRADLFLSGDKRLVEVSKSEGLSAMHVSQQK